MKYSYTSLKKFLIESKLLMTLSWTKRKRISNIVRESMHWMELSEGTVLWIEIETSTILLSHSTTSSEIVTMII